MSRCTNYNCFGGRIPFQGQSNGLLNQFNSLQCGVCGGTGNRDYVQDANAVDDTASEGTGGGGFSIGNFAVLLALVGAYHAWQWLTHMHF